MTLAAATTFLGALAVAPLGVSTVPPFAYALATGLEFRFASGSIRGRKTAFDDVTGTSFAARR